MLASKYAKRCLFEERQTYNDTFSWESSLVHHIRPDSAKSAYFGHNGLEMTILS